MLKIQAHQYVKLGQLIHEHGGRIYMATPEEDDPGKPLSAAELKELKSHLKSLSDLCQELGLRVAKRGIDRAIETPPRTDGEYNQLVSVVMDEMEDQLFLFVPVSRSAKYQCDPKLPSFPTGASELVHSGNCFAVGEFAACVFHAMRAIEVALDAVRLNLGLAARNTNERSWGNICRDIKDAIGAKGKAWPKQDEYNAIHATLVALKDAWRNQTMHVASSYSEPDALAIMENARAFIARLSHLMDEAGQPPA